MTKTDKQILWIMATILLATRLLAMYLYHTFDDAFITYRYGCNLAAGNGFIYNLGEPVLGTTAPIHGLINALLCALPIPLTTSNPIINSLLDVATLILITRAWPHDRTRATFTLIFGALWAGIPSFGRITVGGLETSWFLCALALILWLHTKKRPQFAIQIAALAYFLRPEAVILIAILILHQLINRHLKTAIQLTIIALANLIPPLLLIRAYYGTFLSQSVISKQNLPPFPLSDVLDRFIGADPTILPLILIGTLGLLITRHPDHKMNRLIAAWTLLYAASYLIRRPLVWPWYGAPLYFGFAVLMASLLTSLSTRLNQPAVGRLIRLGAIALPIVLWGAVAYTQGRTTIRQTVYQPLQAWCDTHATTDTTIIADDIGAVGYYCLHSHITDTAGLVTPGVQIYRDAARLVREGDADYIFFVFKQGTQSLMNRDGIRGRYQPIKLFSHRNQTELNNLQYPAGIWTQEYLLFEKMKE